MKYIEFGKSMGGFPVFSLADIRQADPAFHRRRLNEWQEKGYLKKVIKGYYIFADLPLDEKELFEIANRIYAPSYVSFEMALAYYGLIPESVYGITSASTRKTMHFKTTIGEFSYRAIRPKLYFGFEYLTGNSRHAKIASPEKALLDYFYLHPELSDADGFKEMRVSREVVSEKINHKKLMSYAGVYTQKSLKRRVEAFWEYITHA
jgi:predicted transcriptional regulator of viral defense system